MCNRFIYKIVLENTKNVCVRLRQFCNVNIENKQNETHKVKYFKFPATDIQRWTTVARFESKL